MRIITLTTDFGLEDEYVGSMKGAVLSINPEARIIDITHRIPPQDILRAGLILKWSYPYFPENTVHVCVVDPGVGGNRRILGITFRGAIFLAPDNGILRLIVGDDLPEATVEILNRDFFHKDISRTFHGRDVFAPVAAHLTRGVHLETLGNGVDFGNTVQAELKKPIRQGDDHLLGEVLFEDRFGNLLTSIDQITLLHFLKRFPEKLPVLNIRGIHICGMSESYDSVARQTPLMIIGSRGYLEVSVNCGSAKDILGAGPGTPVQIGFEK
jgi:S-adenosylmethionine hydrolase